MKLTYLLIILTAVINLTLASAQTIEGTMEKYTLNHDNRDRSYLVYTPSNYDDTNTYSLLLVLHPANTTAQQMADMTQFKSLADEHGIIMVFPNSVGGQWNSGNSFDFDDVGFISALIDKMVADYAVDETEVFSLGYSSGGLMTMKLRCALADRLAGIISYAAPMTFAIADDCLSANPVSSMVIMGTGDEVFPYGGKATVANGKISGTFSADQTIGFLAGLNQCDKRPEGVDITNENSRNRAFITRYDCENTITELYTMVGLGHYGWAGQLPLTIDGTSTTLNQAIFDFIKRVKETA